MLKKIFYFVIAVILFSSLNFAQQYYAVLITGDTPEGYANSPKTYNGGGMYSGFDEFWNDTYLMWKLLHDNGFDADHIYTLYGNGNDYPSPNPRYQPGTGQQITKFSAYYSDVQNIFTWLANGNTEHNIPKMTSNDVLFIWTFDHGTTAGNNVSALCLMDGVIWDYDFASYVNQIACQKRIILMQQCYSGGFIDNLQSSKTVILTACSGTEVAYRADDVSPDGSDQLENENYNGINYNHGEFNYHVINALLGKTIIGNTISSDADNNGGISALESKSWEFNRDSYYSSGICHPQWSDQGNLGPASFVYKLMDLAYANKSISSQSTAYNGERKFYRESSGKLHEVFSSGMVDGGEIFYRNSTNGGSTWSNTKRLSDGTMTNLAPCITMGPSSTVIVVWQKKNGSNYNIVFSRSTSGGTSWGSISTIQSNFSCASPGPLPSVSANISTGDVVVVYRSSSGLRYVQSTGNMGYWSSPSTISGTNGNYNSPSTAFYPIASPPTDKCNLAYATNTGYSSTMYYNYYSFESSSWSSATNLSSVLPGSYSQHLNPSVAVSTSTSPLKVHVAWESYSFQLLLPVIIHRIGSLSGFGSQYNVIQYQSANNPSISGLLSDNAWMVFQNQYQSGGFSKIKYYYNGSSWIWGSPSYVSSGLFPQLSVGSNSAKYLWTSGSNSPYTVSIGSETLTKSAPLAFEYSRELNFLDYSLGSSITLEVKQPQIVHKDGTVSLLSFVDAPPDSELIDTKDILRYGNTQSFIPPADIDSLKIQYVVRTIKSGNLLQDANTTLSFDIYDANSGIVLNKIDSRAISKSSDTTKTVYQINIPAANIQNSLKGIGIAICPSVEGQIKGPQGLIASLGHIYMLNAEGASELPKTTLARTAVPEAYFLSQNYPNPFNPSTVISYDLLNAGFVTLRVYDIVGKEVATLVNGNQPAGTYNFTFDASQLASGIYFYQIRTGNFISTKKMILIK
ncbi:MAG: T9SS type A sorting domain-containing protein [Ignavibacteriaceae bacterium]